MIKVELDKDGEPLFIYGDLRYFSWLRYCRWEHSWDFSRKAIGEKEKSDRVYFRKAKLDRIRFRVRCFTWGWRRKLGYVRLVRYFKGASGPWRRDWLLASWRRKGIHYDLWLQMHKRT